MLSTTACVQIRGNLRAKKEEVLDIVDRGVHELFGERTQLSSTYKIM
jgi:hypothetical protein